MVIGRIAAVVAVAILAMTVWTGVAAAAEQPTEQTGVVIGTDSQSVAAGATAVRSMLGSLESFDIDTDKATLTLDTGHGSRDLSIDYGDLMKDRRAAGVGYAAGAYFGLGLFMRALRLLRGLFALLGG